MQNWGVCFSVVGGLGTNSQKPLVPIMATQTASTHAIVLWKRVTRLLGKEERYGLKTKGHMAVITGKELGNGYKGEWRYEETNKILSYSL